MKTIKIKEYWLSERCANGHRLKAVGTKSIPNWGWCSCPICFPEIVEDKELVTDLELELNIINQTTGKQRKDLRMQGESLRYSFNGNKIWRLW